jgi:hypothetical protein
MRAIRARPMIVVMGDKTGIETAEESKAANPYGDVALGVECAWPQEVLATTASEESAE